MKSDVEMTTVIDGNEMISKDNIIQTYMFPPNILDGNINISSLKKNYSSEALQTLKVAITSIRNIADWNCLFCKSDVHIDISLVCDGCLGWFHKQCDGLKRAPKTTF